jgi:multicomponent Na+:H+ antiporter subunit G
MELIQEIISVLFIVLGMIFMMIAALGILRLPDFYIRMSAITKAGTMGVGLIVVGIAIYFNDLLIGTKSLVIISFMLLTAPVGAHIIARAAYKQGVSFWKKNLVDELAVEIEKRENCREIIKKDPGNIAARFGLIDSLTSVSATLGGSLKKAVLVADEIKKIDMAEGNRALGIIYTRAREYKLAEQEFREAIKASGGHTSYWYELGNFYQEAELYFKAFHVFERMYNKDNKEVSALLETGKISALSGQELERGENSLKKFMESSPPPEDPLLSRAAYYMGIIYMKKNEFSLAKEYLGKSLEYDPQHHDAIYALNSLKRKDKQEKPESDPSRFYTF